MAGEILGKVAQEILVVYNEMISSLPPSLVSLINLFLLVLVVVIYAVFVWKFYRFIAQKNIIELNLRRFSSWTSNLFVEKVMSAFFYFVEYIIILPFLIFFWFSVFTLFLIFLNESLSVEVLLLVSATVIAAIRMSSYYSEDLSKDLAKLLPFTLLAISILNPKFFQIQRVAESLSQIPTFLNDIAIYLFFIILLEIILRTFDLLFALLGFMDVKELEKEEE